MIGELAALTAAFLWSAGSFLFTNAAQRIGSIQLNVDRMSLATIFLIITIVIFQIPFTISSSQILYLVISGFIGLVVGDTFLFRAFKEMGPRLSLLIYSCNPAIAAVLAYFLLSESLPIISYLGIILTLTGISFVVLEKPKNDKSQFKVTKASIFYAFMSAVGQAGGLILAKYATMTSDIPIMVATLVRIGSAALTLMIVASIFKRYKNPIKLYNEDRETLKRVGIGSIIGPYLGISLSFVAINYTKIGIASTLLSTVPLLVLPMSAFVYKERVSLRSIVGAIVSVIGVALLFMTK